MTRDDYIASATRFLSRFKEEDTSKEEERLKRIDKFNEDKNVVGLLEELNIIHSISEIIIEGLNKK